jgi:alkylation response protein AidB-like acyl-CoA dehydrogenase
VAQRQADGLGSANLKLEGVAAQRLDAADANAVLSEVLDLGNAAIMAEAVGALEASLTMTAEYLKTREQFGAPIGANQALQHPAPPTSTPNSSTRAVWLCTLAWP